MLFCNDRKDIIFIKTVTAIKAANKKNNDFTSPLYLFKAGQIAMELKDFGKAESLFTKIKENYSKSDQGRDIEKYLAAAKYAN